MFCTKCGTQNGPGENFCTKCGTMLEANSPPAGGVNPTPAPPPQSPPPPGAGAYTPPPAPPAPPPQQPPPPPPQPNPQYPGANQYGQAPPPQGAPPPYGQQPPYDPQSPYVQPANAGNYRASSLQSNAIITDGIAAIKMLFSPKPENSVKSSMESSNHTWVIHGAIYVLVCALFMVLFTNNIVRAVLRDVPADFRSDFREMLFGDGTLGWLFGTSLILTITHLFGMMGGIKLMYVIFKIDVPFVKIMNLVASSTLFYSLLSLVALFISFFSVGFGAFAAMYFLILLGTIFYIALLLSGIKSAADGKISMFWPSFTFVFSYAVSAAVAFAMIDFERFGVAIERFLP